MDFILIGAGGHAKVVVDAIVAGGGRVAAYADPNPAPWLEAEHIADDDITTTNAGWRIAMGLGGTTPDALGARLRLFDTAASGREAPPIVHPSATVSPGAELASGTIVLAKAVVQPSAVLERGVIVNTAAIVEHDCRVGAGAHIAPRATLLGEVAVGECAMIGAGAMLLPRVRVAENQLVLATKVVRR